MEQPTHPDPGTRQERPLDEAELAELADLRGPLTVRTGLLAIVTVIGFFVMFLPPLAMSPGPFMLVFFPMLACWAWLLWVMGRRSLELQLLKQALRLGKVDHYTADDGSWVECFPGSNLLFRSSANAKRFSKVQFAFVYPVTSSAPPVPLEDDSIHLVSLSLGSRLSTRQLPQKAASSILQSLRSFQFESGCLSLLVVAGLVAAAFGLPVTLAAELVAVVTALFYANLWLSRLRFRKLVSADLETGIIERWDAKLVRTFEDSDEDEILDVEVEILPLSRKLITVNDRAVSKDVQVPEPDEKKRRRSKAAKRRLVVYGSLVAIAWGFYVWQPYEYDLFQKQPPNPNPVVDPNSKFLFSPEAKVLVVTAHPDDSAFYIGGLLTQLHQAKAQIYQVLCTDGDKGYYPFEDWQRNRRERREEAIAEAKVWGGKSIWFLSEPDGRLRPNEHVISSIQQIIEEVKPDYIICFDGIYPPRMSHQDHRRSGDAATEAAKRSKIPKWVIHFSTSAPNWTIPIDEQWDAQQHLLQIHASQFHGKRLEGVTNMVESTAEKDGARIGTGLGEGFRCEQLR